MKERRLLSLARTGLLLLGLICLGASPARSQDRAQYLLGEGEGLEMIVHILGEVQKPGEYRVGDRTTLLELLSKAGGPTEFSRLSGVKVRRLPFATSRADSLAPRAPSRIEIIDVNLDLAFQKNAAPSFVLRPGDVVLVPKNSWSRWRGVAAVVRDLSVVASAYFLYLRATKD